jgi:hypothetical protein
LPFFLDENYSDVDSLQGKIPIKLRKPLIALALALALAVVVSVVSGFLSPAQAQAGSRTGQTTISWIVAKQNHTEIKMDGGSSHACGGDGRRWVLSRRHPNYEALYTGLMAEAQAGHLVDLVGSTCTFDNHALLDWAYVYGREGAF